MSIANWPLHERPREKLLACGAKNLSDAELLAIFIHSGTKGKTALDLACSLLKHFGGIRNIFDASREQICKSSGIGKAKYVQLQAILEVARRYLEEQLINTNTIYSAEEAYLYLTAKLRNHKREVFACLLLNDQNRIIHYEELFYGTINNLTIYAREVAKVALQYNSSAIIFAHNHPIGVATPSPEDMRLTNSLTKILRPLNIRVLDHIIIGTDRYLSLVDQNMTEKSLK
jgi:DNA repair protein RadC